MHTCSVWMRNYIISHSIGRLIFIQTYQTNLLFLTTLTLLVNLSPFKNLNSRPYAFDEFQYLQSSQIQYLVSVGNFHEPIFAYYLSPQSLVTLCPKKKFTPRFLGYTNNYEGRDSYFHVFCYY